ncbi:hypothetical protein ACLB2K_051603 [Fragaria x ananassa]
MLNLFVFALPLLLFTIFLIKWFSSTEADNHLPPSPPRLPILGNLHQLGTRPHRSLQQLAKQYHGGLMMLHFGSRPVIKETLRLYPPLPLVSLRESIQDAKIKGCEIAAKTMDFQLIPFGGGRRGCPGILFAMTTVELVLATLVHKFEWALPRGARAEDMNMTECSGVVIHREVPLIAMAVPRS